MEIPSVSAQANAIQSYAEQRQDRRPPQQSEEITRKEAEDVASQAGDRVTLSRESRAVAVPQAEKSQRQDETERSSEARAQENEQLDQARLRSGSTPRSISQALNAYKQASLV
jgi:hypothetical protein